MTRSRRSPLVWLFSAILAIAFVSALVLTPSTALAQAATDSANTSAPAGIEVPANLGFTVPGWLTTALSIFATVSLAYQALIAFAHKRAAETADLDDDKWIASLEAKAWFRILDKIFYWGGYLGAKIGGKKL